MRISDWSSDVCSADLNVRDCVHVALARAGISRHGLAAIGITNQRETCVLWDRAPGRPIHNAIVWQATRTEPIMAALAEEDALGRDRFRPQTGLQPICRAAGRGRWWTQVETLVVAG